MNRAQSSGQLVTLGFFPFYLFSPFLSFHSLIVYYSLPIYSVIGDIFIIPSWLLFTGRFRQNWPTPFLEKKTDESYLPQRKWYDVMDKASIEWPNIGTKRKYQKLCAYFSHVESHFFFIILRRCSTHVASLYFLPSEQQLHTSIPINFEYRTAPDR